MKRSVQEIVELVVFGIIALLVGTGLLWVAGWIMQGLGWVFQFVAGLLWTLLKYVVPVVIAAALVYWLVRFLMQRSASRSEVVPAATGGAGVAVAPGAESVEADAADTWDSFAQDTPPDTAASMDDAGAAPPAADTALEIAAAENAVDSVEEALALEEAVEEMVAADDAEVVAADIAATTEADTPVAEEVATVEAEITDEVIETIVAEADPEAVPAEPAVEEASADASDSAPDSAEGEQA